MKIHPLSEYVWIIPDKEDKEKSKVYVAGPDDKPQPWTGVVVAVGQAVDDEIKKGKRVSYRKYGADEVAIDKDKYIVCKCEDILAILE